MKKLPPILVHIDTYHQPARRERGGREGEREKKIGREGEREGGRKRGNEGEGGSDKDCKMNA
jgi:hypothetical protein